MVADLHLIGDVAQTLLATTVDLVGITDEDGTLRFVNDAARTILGFEPAGMVGISVFEFMHPDEIADAVDAVTAAVPGREAPAEPLHLRVRTADRGWRNLEVVPTNLLADPTVRGVAFTARATPSSAAFDPRFHTMFEQSPVPQTLVGSGDDGIIANKTFAALFGTCHEALLHTDPETLLHPGDLERFANALAQALSEPSSSAPLELHLRTANGTLSTYECVGRKLEDGERVGGLLITANDISQRKIVEARLRAAEQRSQVLFERTPMIVSILDLDGRIVDINPMGCELLGAPREVLIGQPAEVIVHPDDRALAKASMMLQLDGDPTAAELRVVTVSGTELYVSSRAELVATGDDGDTPYVVTLQTDITARKRLERELERRATHDHLTGLRNRASFDDHLERLIDALRCRRACRDLPRPRRLQDDQRRARPRRGRRCPAGDG